MSNKSNKKQSDINSEIIEKRKNEILGILIIAIGILSGLALFSPNGVIVGNVGQKLYEFYHYVIGQGSILIPILLLLWGITLIRFKGLRFNSRLAGFIICYITIISIFHTYKYASVPLEYAGQGSGGGYIGGIITWLFIRMFGNIGSYVLLTAFLLIGILLWFDILLISIMEKIKDIFTIIINKYAEIFNKKKEVDNIEKEADEADIVGDYDKFSDENEEEDIFENYPDSEIGATEEKEISVRLQSSDDSEETEEKTKEDINYSKNNEISHVNYSLPNINLLKNKSKRRKKPGNKSETLENTLQSFGVDARVIKVSHGPTITRYEVQPASGVKVSKIVSLADDIALALAAPGVRIEAPIPGKAVVGVEVPHQKNITVCLHDIISRKEFKNTKSKLPLALGMGIDGEPIVTDLSKMPHVLVAGATGSGKSVCINTIIASLLYKATPDEIKLLLVDPKKVELSVYKGLPHLFAPVVTDPKKASSILKLVVDEMESRYELFSSSGTRGIFSYNKSVAEDEKLPYIVVIIDELSDLMMVAAKEVEDSICRLAQMARAAGIHLVIATQRPSVDVITGLIKANIPSRISFSVSSQTDSRTILDMGGAEKLLGEGDMLFAPQGSQKPKRIQGAFIDNDEIKYLIDFVKNQANPDYEFNLDDIKEVKLEMDNDKDELYEDAVKLVVEYRASISMLQRRLHIGHSRAARLIDMMEEDGIVGPYAGSKPRDVLITEDELDQYLNNDNNNNTDDEQEYNKMKNKENKEEI